MKYLISKPDQLFVRLLKFTLFLIITFSFFSFSLSNHAFAATWLTGTDPSLSDLSSSDPTHPIEDIFGDNPDNTATERQADIRSTYSAVDGVYLWIRSYVDSFTGSPSQVEFSWYLDTDNNSSTGGPASAGGSGIPVYPGDTYNGYEYAIVDVDSNSFDVYEWNGDGWNAIIADKTLGHEKGTSTDPLDASLHDYVQVSEELSTFGIKVGDEVRIFSRSWIDTPAPGYGDINGGVAPANAGSWAPYDSPSYATETHFFPISVNVYLKGDGFSVSTTYKCAYYDTTSSLAFTHTIASDADGILLDLVDSGISEGTWHAVVYDVSDTPEPTYTATDEDIIADTYYAVIVTPPPPPVIHAPLTGTITNDSTPTLIGTAKPNSTVTVYDDGANLGSTPADGSGDWSFTTPSLTDGTHVFTATAFDGVYMSSASNQVTVTIDTQAPPPPVIISPPTGTVTNDATPTLLGTADPGSTVTIYVDGAAVGETIADGSGNWSFTLPALGDGEHVIEGTASDGMNVSEKSTPVQIIIGASIYPYITNVTFDNVVIINNDYIAADSTIRAKITVEAVSGIDPDSIVIIVDEGTAQENVIDNLAGYYDTGTNILTFQLSGNNTLSTGTHTIKIDAATVAGNKASDATPDRSVVYIVNVDLGKAALIKPVRGYPNPFNPPNQSIKITYHLNKDVTVKIFIYNTNADLIWQQTFAAGTPGGQAGYNEVVWDGIDAFQRISASGAYLVRLMALEGNRHGRLGKTKIAIYR